MADITQQLNEHFSGKPYNQLEILEFLKGKKYTNINILNITPPKDKGLTVMKRFQMDFYKEKRTLFVGMDNEGIIRHFRMDNMKLDSYPDNSNVAIGCILLIIVLVLAIWGLSSCISSGIDYEDDDYNPYTEDFDGDGIGGDKDDHDILHQLPTLPDGE